MPCGRNIYPFPKLSKDKAIELSNNDCLQKLTISPAINDHCTVYVNPDAREDAKENQAYNYAVGRIPRELNLDGPDKTPMTPMPKEEPETKNDWE